MKKPVKEKQVVEETIFGHILKKVKSFSRIQILSAVTVVVGIILAVLVLSGDETSPGISPAKVPNIPTQLPSEEPSSNVERAVFNGANRPPVVSAVMLSPNLVIPGTPVHVEVKASDPDQDDISFEYTWKINGEVVAGQSGEEFDTTNLHKGEMLTCTVLPSDGKEQGSPLESNGVTIQNRPPEITSMPSAGVSSGSFSYQVVAKDPDNDPLQFSLEGVPQEMMIDPAGLIQWEVPKGLQGKQQVRVIVSDGSASSFQAFNLNLGEKNPQ